MEGPSPRIVKETKTIQSDPVPGIAFQPDPTNYKHFYIDIQGIHMLTQALQVRATKAVNLRLNCCCRMTTLCLLPKLFSIRRYTTPILVHCY